MDTEERFRYYYGKYSSNMLQVAVRNGIPYDETEDLLQETFLSFYVHYSAELPEACVRALLFKIMKSRCTDYWRKKENQVLCSAAPDQIMHTQGEQSKMTVRDTLDIVIENLFIEDISEAVLSMRDEWKRVYVLYEILGRSMDEISEMLGISVSACRMRNSRGKRYLAEYIREYDEKKQIRCRRG